MPSLEPERADPTAWTAEGRAEGRAGDWPVPQKGVALLPNMIDKLGHDLSCSDQEIGI